ARLRADLGQAPKLAALRDVLLQAGIGRASAGEEEEDRGAVSSLDAGHRVLVFAQLRAVLDLAEECVLRPLGVPFLRIDGSLQGAARFETARRFEEDCTVPVMLLTTQVGGLGLNLTSADTVVFLEHDWNPMRDLQAMDRAHRLGQRRTVQVYRLVVRGTLEEDIMSLQSFKRGVADAVVTAENASVGDVEAQGVVDLVAGAGEAPQPKRTPRAKGLKALLEGLEDLDESEAQYRAQFGDAAFAQSLKNK
ncbi:hypothetical protein H632_c2014p0, partial [Helicosporidium sp. ATCC 50920]